MILQKYWRENLNFSLNRLLFSTIMVLNFVVVSCDQIAMPENHNPPYTVLGNSVVQGKYMAKALSGTELVSDYQIQQSSYLDPKLTFKFALNGQDNEMISGSDHEFTCFPDENGICKTPLIAFGEKIYPEEGLVELLHFNTKVHVKLDMRDVLAQFESKGFYENFNGERTQKEDFKGVYIAGGFSPLTWDFSELQDREDLKLSDENGDGIFEIILDLSTQSNAQKGDSRKWELSKNLSAYPGYSSDQLLVDVLYNLSLEEMILNIEDDGTFRTGAKWDGVWTRDVSYSIILGLGLLEPEVSKESLRRKVKSGRIIQDTGTGGAYPVSTDRVVWAIAAWEVYQVTGERAWLEEVFPIIQKSLQDDFFNAFNPDTGLVKGESSFLDWREQTYPDWMQPADIYESETLGTSAVHYQANRILSLMAGELGDQKAAGSYNRQAQNIKEGINRQLWLEEKGYYGQYLYGRNFKIISPRSEALGGALSVLFDIADPERQKRIVQNTPVTDYGIPSIYPQIPNIPPYHNNGVWPFVQAFWSLAAKKAGNETALTKSLDALYRAAALFLTNKENFVAENGDYAGTQINSDRQLWSVAGNLGMVYKVFFGLDFENDQLTFNPFVPEKYAGKKSLKGLKIRKAILDIEMVGFGNQIQSISLDGRLLERPEIPLNLVGEHRITIMLSNNNSFADNKVNHQKIRFSPSTPKVKEYKDRLEWNKQENVAEYLVLKNGEIYAKTANNQLEFDRGNYAEYQVIAVNYLGDKSFASEPLAIVGESFVKKTEAESFADPALNLYDGYSGGGYIEVSKTVNRIFEFNLDISEEGIYALDFSYSNGNGSIRTDNRCALRSLSLEGKFIGTVVFPQRGIRAWNEWGWSNAVKTHLKSGTNSLTLSFEDFNENMNGEINQAMIDFIRISKIE